MPPPKILKLFPKFGEAKRSPADVALFKKMGAAPERRVLQRLAAEEGRGAEPWVPKVKGKREGTRRNDVGDWEAVKARKFSDEWPKGVNPLRQLGGYLNLSDQQVQDLLRGGGFTHYRKGGVQELTPAAVRINAFFADREIPAAWKNPVLEALARSGNLDNLKLSQAHKQMPGLSSYVTWSYRGNERQSLEMREFDNRAGTLMRPPKGSRAEPRGPVKLTEADPTLGQMYWTGRARANEMKGFDPAQMQDAAIYGSKSQMGRKAEEMDWEEREQSSVREDMQRRKDETGRSDVEKLDRQLEERGEGQYNRALLRVQGRSSGTQAAMNLKEQARVERVRERGPRETEVQGSPEFLQKMYAYKEPRKSIEVRKTQETTAFKGLGRKGKAARAVAEQSREWDPSTPIIGELRRAAAKGDVRAREILEQVGGADASARDRQMGGVAGSRMMEPEDRELLQLLGLI